MDKTIGANKFSQCGAQFEIVETGKLALDTTFKGLPGVDYDDEDIWMATAPHIQIVKADGTPDMYWFLNDGWYDDGSDEGSTKAGWCDVAGNLVDLEIVPGAGFWTKNADVEDRIIHGVGQVAAADSTEVKVPASIFSIQANVYPTDVNLNDSTKVSFPDIVGVNYDDDDVWMATAPHIQVVKADGTPDMYWFLNDGWYDDGSDEGSTKAGWCDVAGNIVDVKITAQSGFWAKATTGAFTIEYVK
ncbi:MAG: hypothetical protein ACI4RA_07030 [Kiritimatiellia bacterium]